MRECVRAARQQAGRRAEQRGAHLIHVDALRAQNLARLVRLHFELRIRGRAGGRAGECVRLDTHASRRDARPHKIGAAQCASSRTHLIPRVLNQLARKVLAQIFGRLLDPLDRLCGAARKGETGESDAAGWGCARGAVTAATQRGEGAPTRRARSTHSAEGEAIVLVAEVRLWRRQLVHFQLDLREAGAGGSAGA